MSQAVIDEAARICRKVIAHLKAHPHQAQLQATHEACLNRLSLLTDDADPGHPWDIWEDRLQLFEEPDAATSPDILAIAHHVITEEKEDPVLALLKGSPALTIVVH